MRSLDIAATGMQAQQTNVEVISNNIANMTTTGFKRQRAEFQDLIYQNLRRVGSNSSSSGSIVPTGAQIGLGVKTAAIYRINEQGNLQQTSNSLDMAIQGNGYFQVTLPSGTTAYTRDGTFGLAPDGRSSPRTATWCSRASRSRPTRPASPSTPRARCRRRSAARPRRRRSARSSSLRSRTTPG